jgi:ABC-type antimicrobial peptide transport system permease subunit
MFDLSLAAGAFLVLVFLLILAGLLSDGGTRSMALRGFRRRGKTAWLTIVALSVGTAVIMSSLGVGDALKGLIVDRADMNLNGVDVFVISADFVNANHVDSLRTDPNVTGLCDEIEPTLMLPIVLHNNISGRTTSRAMLYGLDPTISSKIGQFHWNDGSSDRTGMPLEDGKIVLNSKAAKELDAYRHQDIYIGLDSPALRKETMFTEPGIDHVNMTISQIVDNDGLGRLQFNVQDVQPAVYMTLKTLRDVLKVGNKMNAILVALKDGVDGDRAMERINASLTASLTASDMHLRVAAFPESGGVPAHVRVTSDRVFFDKGKIYNPDILTFIPQWQDHSYLSTYFVDALRLRHQNGTEDRISYSTITGFDPELDSKYGIFTQNGTGAKIKGDLKPGEIGITNWTAMELGAHVGDIITVNWSIMDDHLDLIKHSGNFTVVWIVDMVGKANDAGLMPDFPGIGGIGSCFKWDPPFPMDLSSIQPKDEAYWKQFKGIPKAYIVLADAEAMWGNDQGNLTMVKVPNETTVQGMTARLDQIANSATVGMSIVPIRDQLVSSASAMDIFLQMFLAFGTITIAAAILFVASTFRMMMDGRRSELGMLRSIGISRNKIMKDLLAEGMVYATIAGVIGLTIGWITTGALVVGLDTVWSSVVGGQQVIAQAFVPTHIMPGSVALSLGVGYLLSLILLIILARSASRTSVMEARGHEGPTDIKGHRRHASVGTIILIIGADIMFILFLVLGIPKDAQIWRSLSDYCLIVLLWGVTIGIHEEKSDPDLIRYFIPFPLGAVLFSIVHAYFSFQQPFVSVLALFVIDGLFITISLFGFLVTLFALIPKASKGSPNVVAFSFMKKNMTRTAMTIGVFALIIFSIVSLSVIISVQNSALGNAAKEQGGGFDIMAEATRPIGPDLNDQAARQRLGVELTQPAELFMVRTVGTSGAVCSNMNPQYPPRLIGANDRFIQSSDFPVASSLSGKGTEETWAALDTKVDGRIPIMVDENTLIIYLGYAAYEGALGHVFTVSAENGQVELVVAGILSPSVIAGNFVMYEDFLKQLYPTSSGYRVVFAKTAQPATVIGELEKGLSSYGLDARNVKDIVKETTSAEQGYMNLFQAYLGAGLVLGVVALAVTEARQVTERRRDIAMLRAIGFSRGSIGKVFYIEAAIVGIMSLAIGLVAGLALAVTSGPAWGLASVWGMALPIPFLVVFSIVLMAVVLASAAYPASRASRLAPAAILKEE